MTDQPHLSAGQLARYLEQTVSPSERAVIEAHLAECDECRQELVEAGRVVRTLGRRRWVRWVPVGVAAAAVLAIVLRPTGGPNPDTERGSSGGEGIPRVAAVSPALDAVISADSLTFIWRAVAPDVQYQLRLTDRLGNVVWSVTQADTSGVLPTSISLAHGQSYFWYVDALFPDGHSGTTGARHFRTAP